MTECACSSEEILRNYWLVLCSCLNFRVPQYHTILKGWNKGNHHLPPPPWANQRCFLNIDSRFLSTLGLIREGFSTSFLSSFVFTLISELSPFSALPLSTPNLFPWLFCLDLPVADAKLHHIFRSDGDYQRGWFELNLRYGQPNLHVSLPPTGKFFNIFLGSRCFKPIWDHVVTKGGNHPFLVSIWVAIWYGRLLFFLGVCRWGTWSDLHHSQEGQGSIQPRPGEKCDHCFWEQQSLWLT